MRSTQTICPDCKGDANFIGAIPPTNIFAGRRLDHILPGGGLYRCRKCALGFRWPRLMKSHLDRLYEQGNETTWSVPVLSRRDWNIARNWLEQFIPAGSQVLDMGCFDGGFLEPLTDSYRCYGIEIHPEASSRAENKGIEIIGKDFSNVAGVFDCITAFDVIEHVEQPESFLNSCMAALKRGGYMLISTGNMDAFSFRRMGSRYWYCVIPEHISFLSPIWVALHSESMGFQIIKQARFSHGNRSLACRIKQSISNLLYHLVPYGFRVMRRLGLGNLDIKSHTELIDCPPGWASAKDHFIVLIRKDY